VFIDMLALSEWHFATVCKYYASDTRLKIPSTSVHGLYMKEEIEESKYSWEIA
jgi:hypothetical protein